MAPRQHRAGPAPRVAQLAALQAKGAAAVEQVHYAEPAPVCAVSRQPCWLLGVVSVVDGAEVVTCAEHAGASGGGDFGAKTVRVTRSEKQLLALQLRLEDKLKQRQTWLENAAAALDGPPPTMAHVHALLAEAKQMQISEEVGDRLTKLQQKGLDWQARTTKLLNSRSEFPAETCVELISTGEALPLQPTAGRLPTPRPPPRGGPPAGFGKALASLPAVAVMFARGHAMHPNTCACPSASSDAPPPDRSPAGALLGIL